jgi:hypothetical protein
VDFRISEVVFYAQNPRVGPVLDKIFACFMLPDPRGVFVFTVPNPLSPSVKYLEMERRDPSCDGNPGVIDPIVVR